MYLAILHNFWLARRPPLGPPIELAAHLLAYVDSIHTYIHSTEYTFSPFHPSVFRRSHRRRKQQQQRRLLNCVCTVHSPTASLCLPVARGERGHLQADSTTSHEIAFPSQFSSAKHNLLPYLPTYSYFMTEASSKEKSGLPAQSSASQPPKDLFKMATGHARYFRYILFAFFVCGLDCCCVDEHHVPDSLHRA
jgi:hypothetical protein